MTPTKNKVMETMMTGIRPKIWLKEAKLGWKTVEASRKDVPAQKASMAVPCSFFAITGRATLIDVPSRATMRVRTAKAAKASRKRVDIVNSGAADDVVSAFGFSEDMELEEDEIWDVEISCPEN